MKFHNALMAIENIIISIVVFVSTIFNHMYYYESNKCIFFIMLFIIVVANGVFAVANFKRNRKATIVDSIITILWIVVIFLGMTINANSNISSDSLIINMIVALISILSIVVLVLNPKTKKATKLNAINIEVEKNNNDDNNIYDAFKIKDADKKEEAVGMANLFAKIVVPILWGMFAIGLAIQIIEPSKIYNEDKKILLTGLQTIGEYQQKKGYIYKSAEKEYQFLDENGTYIGRINAEKLSNFDDNYIWKINYPDQNHQVEILIAKQKNKVQIINTEGRVFIELEKRYPGEEYLTICYLMKHAVEVGDVPKSASINFEENKERKEQEQKNIEAKSEEEYGFESRLNAYYKIGVTPELKEFEENANYQYLYFKNSSLNENIIQIAITKENSATVPFLEKYLKHKENVFNITDEHKNAIQEFYRYKKEYKLINLPTKTSVNIDARDMFYDNFTIKGEEKEAIYAYPDGSIPFMNTEYNSFVTTDGRILGMLETKGNTASVFALVDDTNIIATRIDTKLSILYDKEKLIKEGVFKENRHEGKKIVDLGVSYYLYPVDKADTNKECIIQTKGYSNDNGIARADDSQIKFVGTIIFTILNKKNNRYETYYYSHGDLLLLFSQTNDPKMYAVDMKTALPDGYGPYDLIGIYDK